MENIPERTISRHDRCIMDRRLYIIAACCLFFFLPSPARGMEAFEVKLEKERTAYQVFDSRPAYLIRRGMDVFLRTDRPEVCLGSIGVGEPDEEYQEIGPPDVKAFRLTKGGDSFFFLLHLAANKHVIYTLVDASGYTPGKDIFGDGEVFFFNPSVSPLENRISYYTVISDSLTLYSNYIFSDTSIRKEFDIHSSSNFFHKKIVFVNDTITGETFKNTRLRHTVTRNTFLHSTPGEKNVTTNRLSRGQEVTLVDAALDADHAVWLKARVVSHHAQGWISAHCIDFDEP